MGKAEENKRIKRNSLLAQAYSQFTSKGISNTSISDIASGAGVAKGTFYFYFKDKDDLIDHLIARKAAVLLRHALDALESRLKNEGEKSVEDMIIIIADDIIDELAKDPKLVKFLNRNLHVGFYVKAISDDDFIEGLNIATRYQELINSGGRKWKNDRLMIYTIIELVGSTIYSVILENVPSDIETYKPYLFDSIRAIMATFSR